MTDGICRRTEVENWNAEGGKTEGEKMGGCEGENGDKI
jgi:hypothetical protein